jgi:hypothetical protein
VFFYLLSQNVLIINTSFKLLFMISLICDWRFIKISNWRIFKIFLFSIIFCW